MLKGKMDTVGNLHIERAGVLVPQFCPYKRFSPCGDWCPKFGEPYKDCITSRDGEYIDGWVLSLCTRDQLFFTELIDKRK